ncbi:hypothetical protein JYT16_02240 [Gemmatimonas aurantiaca]|nr:hypothetical protein [Gemmatimonas aurantiaca]
MNNIEPVTIEEMLAKIGDKEFEVTSTDVIAIPSYGQPRAVARVCVKLDGRLSCAIGEASIEEDSPITKNSVVSVAETRALARALRWATRTSTVSAEEIPSVSRVSHSDPEVGILPDEARTPGHWKECQQKWFQDMADEGAYTVEDRSLVKELESKISNNEFIRGSDYYDLINRMKAERERNKK